MCEAQVDFSRNGSMCNIMLNWMHVQAKDYILHSRQLNNFAILADHKLKFLG